MPLPQFVSTNLFSLVIMKYSRHIPFHVQLYGSYLIIICINILLPVLAHLFPDSTGYYITLSSTFLLGFATCVNQACCLSFANMFRDDQFTVFFVTGTGIAGLFIGLMRMMCLAIFGQSSTGIFRSTLLYFVIAGLFMIVVQISTYLFRKGVYAQYHIKQ